MAELARGSVADRPWGRTFATLGLRGVTGQLTLVAGGKRFVVAFDQGAVVAAASPMTSDAAVRVALTNHLVSSSQVAEIARRLASAPERDEVLVIAEQARLGPDHTLRLRRRVIAQRAARTFSVDHGAFTVTDDTELAILEGCALDVRAVVYLGARSNLAEARLSAEVDLLGAWFRLRPGIDDDLPQFGFTDVEQPVVERLRDGGTLAEIEDFATSFVDGRTVRAVVYALAACGACDLEPRPGQPRSRSPSVRTPSPAPLSPPQVARSSAMSTPVPEAVIPSKTTTRRSAVPPPPQRPSLASGSATLQPPGENLDVPAWRDTEGESPPLGDPVRSAAGRTGRATSSLPSTAAIGRDDTGDRAPWPSDAGASGPAPASASEWPGRDGARERIRRPTDEAVTRDAATGAPRLPVREALGLGTTSGSFRVPSDEALRRDASSGSLRLPLEEEPMPDGAAGRARRASEVVVRRDGSSASLRLPAGDAAGSDGASGPMRRASEVAARDRSSGSLRLPAEDAVRSEGVIGRTRRASEAVVRRDGSSGSLRLPGEGAPVPGAGGRAGRVGEVAKRDGSSGVIRLPTEDELRGGSSGSIRLPDDEALRWGSQPSESSGSIQLPSDEAMRDAASGASRPGEDERHRRGRHGSSAGLRLPLEPEAGPGLVVRRVTAARPAPARQVARVDTPASHSVKALIAQRLKLLDGGTDHFQLLGVPHDVAAEPLRKAYFALARQLHPDRLAALGISDEGRHAQRLFAQINAGFATLSDPGRRAAYLDVLRRGGEAAVRAEQARAEDLARRILEAEETFRRGELALRRDQPAAAVVELERAIQLNPDETDYHAALAWSRFCAAPDKQAVAAATRTALEAAIQRGGRSVTARFYLGRVERMLGRDPDALRHFRDVLAVVPGHAEAAAEVRALEARLRGGGRPRR